jgi:hypothetical protein
MFLQRRTLNWNTALKATGKGHRHQQNLELFLVGTGIYTIAADCIEAY